MTVAGGAEVVLGLVGGLINGDPVGCGICDVVVVQDRRVSPVVWFGCRGGAAGFRCVIVAVGSDHRRTLELLLAAEKPAP